MTLVIVFLLLFGLLPFTSTVRILKWPALNCEQKGLGCKVNINNCIDRDWLISNNFTPSYPVYLEVDIDTREDERGDIMPVIVVRWKAKDDGSIFFLMGTEVEILTLSTNEKICVRYIFLNKLAMQNPAKKMWSFSLDRVVVDPGLSYMVSVSNLPKPNLKHTGYNIYKRIDFPDCTDPRMQQTKTCVETGFVWQPNITLVQSSSASGRGLLSVGFTADEHSENYRVSLKCFIDKQWKDTAKGNQTLLNVIFDLENWPQTCCSFDAEIQPFFPLCKNDCVRRRKTFNICPDPGALAITDLPSPGTTCAVAGVGVLLICFVVCSMLYLLRRRRRTDPPGPAPKQVEEQPMRRGHPRVLVIYSQDHHLYKDIVLKLCAFLQAKCGTEVVLDLLDTTWLGTLGRVPWLDWQWQQVKKSSDKILLLCSAGVQAKWDAMCGRGTVKLREDVLSPIDDMLTPALNLFLPDMQQAAAMGKYLVAYFESVSCERDVPSVFDICVKYKLMKHFEELCFRILDVEKYQPGQVSHIEGIGEEDYFNCPSGDALRHALQAFEAYQFEHPDWFKKECLATEEEALTEYNPLLIRAPPILECVPEFRDGAPIYALDVEINQNGESIYTVTPEINNQYEVSSVLVHPRLDSLYRQGYPRGQTVEPLPGVLVSDIHPHGGDPFYMASPAVRVAAQLTENGLNLEEWPVLGPDPTESPSLPSIEDVQRLIALQRSLSSIPVTLSESAEDGYLPPHPSISSSQPVEMEEEEFADNELAGASGTRPNSGSDQGYISRMSFQDEPLGDSTLAELARLQEELLQISL